MKTILYYTLCRDWFGSRNYKVLGVTSEKSRMKFGRWLPSNDATHIGSEKCIGKFETLEAAQGKIDAVKAVADKYGPLIKANNDEGSRLYSEQEAAFKAVVLE